MTILGYNTTNTMEALAAFIANASVQYEALEHAIAPVDEKITDLQKDWEPRPLSFWSEILGKSIPAIREATASCLSLFDPKRSQETPIPIVMCARHLSYTCNLSHIEEQIEQSGILLTAYRLNVAEGLSVEKQIRERQRLMRALLALSQVIHKAIDDGRMTLKSAPEEQRKILCPSKRLHIVEEGAQ